MESVVYSLQLFPPFFYKYITKTAFVIIYFLILTAFNKKNQLNYTRNEGRIRKFGRN